MTAPYIPRPRTLEEALRAAFMPPIQADATATPPVRPDFSGVPMATMLATSAPMPRGPRESGNPAADRLNARVDRGLAMLGRQAAPSADTPEGWLREMFNPVAAGRGAREVANAAGAQMRRAGRTGNVGDAASAAGLSGLALASVVPGMPGDDAARVAASQIDDVARQGKRIFRGHHGSPVNDLTAFAPNERGIFGTDNPAVATEYTAKRGAFHGSRTGRVYDVEFEMENPLEIDAMGRRHDNIPTPWGEWKPKTFGRLPEGAVNIEAAFQKAIEMGHDGLVVRNVLDSADPTSTMRSTVYAVRSPEQARILNATMQSTTPEASAIRNALVPQAPDAKMIDVDGVMRPRFNARGQLIHPTEDGIRNFWRWATEDGRKPIADEAGLPHVTFSGTGGNVEQYDMSRNRSVLNDRFQGDGIHASLSPDVASRYAEANRNALVRRDDVLPLMEQKLPADVTKWFRNIIDRGYDAASDLPDADMARLLRVAEEAGIDLNDVGDVARVVEGSAYDMGRAHDASDVFNAITGNSGGRLFGEYESAAMQRLGIADAAPRPNVMPLYMRSRNTLNTADRQAARSAQRNGYDGMMFSGEDIIGGEPEAVVFNPLDIKSAIGNSGAFSRTDPRLTAGILAAFGIGNASRPQERP